MIIFSRLIPLLLAIAFVFVVIRVLLYRTGLVFMAKKWWSVFEDCFHVYQTFKVPEFNDENMQENRFHRKVVEYLNSLGSIEDSDFTNLVTGKKSNEIVLRLDPNQRIEDRFLGAKLVWINEEIGDTGAKSLVLKIRRADKRRVLRPYLQHIHSIADEVEQRKKETKLFVNIGDGGRDRRYGRWRSVPFSHPSTFDTIAMESDLKSKVKSDLENFLKSKQYYHRLGRVWKRSYLLYGPPGTGKTSFVAAMANFLNYDVYDLDLSKVRDDADLRLLLLQTTRRSMIVIEDLDLFVIGKSTAVSFSGVLTSMDGLLSSCSAEERIMALTTSGKDGIDPAILRPGRVDVHIHFPLCDFGSFKNMASNYLGLKEHKLFPQVEEIFRTGSGLSPAEIGELMIANRASPTRAIKTVITALERQNLSEARNFRSLPEESGSPGRLLFDGPRPARELRKLYGFLRLKSGRKSESFDAVSGQKDG